MKKFGFLVLIPLILLGCKSSNSTTASKPQTDESPILLSVGGQDVRVNEFKYIYNKNNSRSNDAYSDSSITEYLDLYVKFRLKVLEAEDQKLDTASAFIKELGGYKKQLAKPYLTEKSVTERLTKEAYDRLTQEVRTAHILIKVPEEADPIDTLKAYNKLVDIRKQIVSDGADFGDMAVQHSEDQSAQMSSAPVGYRGDLGYFTALSLVYEYENAMFNTPIGEISPIFRTQFGYHILKVIDRRKSEGEITVSHIMVRAADGLASEDSLEAKRKIDEIYTKASAGEDWNQLAKLFSDDKRSASQGGKIRPFRLGGQLGMPSLENAAFALQNPGDISKPVKTPYGWHVVKLIEKSTLAPYDEMKDELEKKISKKPRAQLNKQTLIKRLKEENNFTEFSAVKTKAFTEIDSSIIKGTWAYDKTLSFLGENIFSVGGDNFTIENFYSFAQKNQRPKKNLSPAYATQLLYDKFVDESIMTNEEAHLEEKYYDYKMLVKEYRDGILLFQLMDENVWSKAVKDTTGLKAFYEERKADYQWDKRAKATIYSIDTQENLNKLIPEVNAKKSNEELMEMFNNESALTLKIDNGTYEKGRSDVIDAIDWTKPSSQLEQDGRYYYVVIDEILPESPKTLKDARGLIISDYQNHLEKIWIEELRGKYSVSINDDVVQSLIKE